MILLRNIFARVFGGIGIILFMLSAGFMAVSYFLNPINDLDEFAKSDFLKEPVSPLEKKAKN